MSLLLATIVEVDSLAKTALAALLAGTAVTLSFSLGIAGATRAGDLRRSGRGVAAALALALAVLALAVSVAIVGLGLIVMISS